MDTIASQITSPTIVYSIFYSGTDQRKHQSSASLAFVRGIHRGPVNSPHKGPVTRKMFPFDDVIMKNSKLNNALHHMLYQHNAHKYKCQVFAGNSGIVFVEHYIKTFIYIYILVSLSYTSFCTNMTFLDILVTPEPCSRYYIYFISLCHPVTFFMYMCVLFLLSPCRRWR